MWGRAGSRHTQSVRRVEVAARATLSCSEVELQVAAEAALVSVPSKLERALPLALEGV